MKQQGKFKIIPVLPGVSEFKKVAWCHAAIHFRESIFHLSGAVSPSAAAKTETSDVESEPEMAEVKDEPHR